MLHLIRERSYGFRACVFVGVLLAKLLLIIRERIGRRGEQLSSLQRQTKLPFVLLVVPVLLKLGLYALCLELPAIVNTPLFVTIVFCNLVIL